MSTDTDTDTASGSTAVAEADGGPPAPPAPPAPEPVPFWQRPYVERYLVPLVVPVLVVFGVVLFVANISRIFLSGHGSVPVVLGTIITVTILAGAAMLSAAPRMRSGSIALIAGGFIAAIVLGGWMSVGTAEGPKEEVASTLAPEGPVLAALDFVSTNDLKFIPAEAEAETGIIGINLENEGGTHTFVIETPGTLFEKLAVEGAGDTAAGRAFFGAEGDYVFYCDVPGHRAAGMEGVITAAGETKTIAQAEAELGGAAAEGGAEAGA